MLWYVCVCVCVCACVCVCLCIYIYIYIYICMYVCMYVCMYIYTYIHTYCCCTCVFRASIFFLLFVGTCLFFARVYVCAFKILHVYLSTLAPNAVRLWDHLHIEKCSIKLLVFDVTQNDDASCADGSLLCYNIMYKHLCKTHDANKDARRSYANKDARRHTRTLISAACRG
jgi:hypothetical protein